MPSAELLVWACVAQGRLLLTGVPEEERHGGMVLKAIDDALTAVRTPALHNRLLEKLQVMTS